MSLIDKSNHGSDWLYENGYKRRLVYRFEGVEGTPIVLKFSSTTPYKLFDRQIKAISGEFLYEVIVNPASETVIGEADIINQPLNYKVPRPNPFTAEEVTITGGEIVDVDQFKVFDFFTQPIPLPESDLQGRDFKQSQVFYLRISRVDGNAACSGIVRYILAETP